jgi:hypothetical protein
VGRKHLLWHGNTEEALDRQVHLVVDLSPIRAHSAAAEKVADGITEFETYIRSNRDFIPNFGERRRQGENDQHRICGIDDQPGSQQTVCEEATDAVDAARRPPVVTNQGESPQQRIGGGVSPVVPAVSS